MKTTIPDTMLNDPAVQRATKLCCGPGYGVYVDGLCATCKEPAQPPVPPMKTPTDKTLPAQADYARAYSSFLLAEEHLVKAPDPAVFGISEDIAAVLRQQCRMLHNQQLDAKAPAVSFTEAEARQAAEDLRDIAAACCEEGWLSSEKVLRVLAQRFDTWRKE